MDVGRTWKSSKWGFILSQIFKDLQLLNVNFHHFVQICRGIPRTLLPNIDMISFTNHRIIYGTSGKDNQVELWSPTCLSLFVAQAPSLRQEKRGSSLARAWNTSFEWTWDTWFEFGKYALPFFFLFFFFFWFDP